MRHGQGFDLVLQDWLRLAGQTDVGRPEPAPGLPRYEPLFDYRPEDMLDAPGTGMAPADLLPMLARLATQMHLGALRHSGREGSLPLQIDGEGLGTTRKATFESHAQALLVMSSSSSG